MAARRKRFVGLWACWFVLGAGLGRGGEAASRKEEAAGRHAAPGGKEAPGAQAAPDGKKSPRFPRAGKEAERALPPPSKIFRLDRHVWDSTGILSDLDHERIQQLLDYFLDRTGYWGVVIVVRELSELGVTSGNIRKATEKLFDQSNRFVRDPSHVVMFVYSLKERKVRIKAGWGYGTEYDPLIQEIVDTITIPYLNRMDKNGRPKKSDVAGAILASLRELLPALQRQQSARQPLLGGSVGQFLSKSWLWFLLALQFLGFLYVLGTKESLAWYLFGAIFGLPVFLGMLILVLQPPEEAAGPGVPGQAFLPASPPPAGGEEHIFASGHW